MGSMNSYLGVSVEAGIFPETSVSEIGFSRKLPIESAFSKTDDVSDMGLSEYSDS